MIFSIDEIIMSLSVFFLKQIFIHRIVADEFKSMIFFNTSLGNRCKVEFQKIWSIRIGSNEAATNETLASWNYFYSSNLIRHNYRITKSDSCDRAMSYQWKYCILHFWVLQFGQESLITYKWFNFYYTILCVNHAIAIICKKNCFWDIQLQSWPIILSIGSQFFNFKNCLNKLRNTL